MAPDEAAEICERHDMGARSVYPGDRRDFRLQAAG